MAKPLGRIGVIADTHGLLREQALSALANSDLIIHAGDVGKLEILDRLRTLAPVVAIKGNVDRAPWASVLPETAAVETGAARIYVIHDIHQLNFDPAAAGFTMVISGHSHQPSARTERGVLYLNPGSAGPRRFRLPVTVAILRVEGGGIEAEHVDLA